MKEFICRTYIHTYMCIYIYIISQFLINVILHITLRNDENYTNIQVLAVQKGIVINNMKIGIEENF